MPSFPSYYLNDLERKRQRSAEMQAGMGAGMKGALGGLDRLVEMQKALAGEAKSAEALAHGREIEAKNQARADTRFKWEGEDRARKVDAETDAHRVFSESVADPLIAKVTGALGEQPAAPVAGAPAVRATPSGLGEDASGVLARFNRALAGAEPEMVPPPPSEADKMEAAKLRKAEADAAIAERKAKGGGSGKVDPLKDAKERKAIADAALAESKAADIGKPVDWDEIDKMDARKLRDAKSSAAGAVESAKAMLAVLDDPEKAKYIGKYRGTFEAGKEALGIGSDASGIRAGMAARFNQYKNLISGAAVSDREKPDLTRVMPDDIDINPDDLRQKILEGIKYAERQYGLASKVLDAGTTKILDAPAPAHGAAPAPGAPTPSAGPLGAAPAREQGETRRAYYERLRAAGMDHQTAMAAARGGAK